MIGKSSSFVGDNPVPASPVTWNSFWDESGRALDGMKSKLVVLNKNLPGEFYSGIAEYHNALLEDNVEIEIEEGNNHRFYKVCSLEEMI